MATATPPELFLRRNSRRRFPSTPYSGARSGVCLTPAKQVFLHDWWLLKAESDSGNKRLGVGGLSSSENRLVRCFLSAPIVKRCDTVTLETVDGFTIMLHGLLNRSRTLENGFDSVLCDHFEIGFPHNWEDYAFPSSDEKPDSVPNNVSGCAAFKTPSSRKSKTNLEEFKKNEVHSPDVTLLNHNKIKTDQQKKSGTRLEGVERSGGPLTRSRSRILDYKHGVLNTKTEVHKAKAADNRWCKPKVSCKSACCGHTGQGPRRCSITDSLLSIWITFPNF